MPILEKKKMHSEEQSQQMVVKRRTLVQALDARAALIFWIVAISVLKALARTASSSPVAKTVVGTESVPALALPNKER